ncbi:MAG: glutathione peroxidase [Halobacteriovoraceae bacterium]|nr:glutathione peroxidase [Halobacteriovoraceae bacterium]|tara:strand:- start:104 stop:580 length:477 start_codon:yes stop_codon:yes gene_type:complete
MNVFDFNANLTAENEISLSKFKGKTLLIVNTASACGFTPQYGELQELYLKYKDQGLEILAFPCNQFGKQESGTDEEIKKFCDLKFKISFPVFSKIEVNGDSAHPLYKFLKEEQPGLLGTEQIKWNFTKFLVNKEGKPVGRFAPSTKPFAIEHHIKKIL